MAQQRRPKPKQLNKSETYRRLTGTFVSFVMVSLATAAQPPQLFFRPSLCRANAVMVSTSMANGNKGLGASFVRLESGINVKIDSVNQFRVSLRYGIERLRFEKELATESYFFYHLKNHAIALCTEIASPVTEHYRIVAGINFSYLFASTEQGGGQRSSGYSYIVALEEHKNLFDFRPHVGIEKELDKKQKKAILISCELSLIGRNAQLKDALISANFPDKYHTIRYTTLFFSAAYRF